MFLVTIILVKNHTLRELPGSQGLILELVLHVQHKVEDIMMKMESNRKPPCGQRR